MDKEATSRAFWTGLGVIYIGGMVLHHLGARPRSAFEREVIPVNEPTALDWVEIGGIIFLT